MSSDVGGLKKEAKIVFTMRVTKQFKKLITDRAKSSNMTASEYVEKAIINTKIKQKNNPVDVARMALNTTQINTALEGIAMELREANENEIISNYDFDKMLDYLLDMRLNLRELNGVSISQ